MKSAFRFTVFISLLLHLLVFLPWLLTEQPAVPKKKDERPLEFTLAPTPQPPKPAEPEPVAPEPDIPPPRHLEDDITKANTSDGLAEQAGGSKQPPTNGQANAQQPTQANETTSPTSPSPTSSKVNPNSPLLSDFLKAQEIAKQQMEKKGLDLQELNEADLADNSVASPLDKEEEEKARWYNEVLKRISQQVNFVWVKPTGLSPDTWGIIRLDIDEYGYLSDAWVHLPSGNLQLDRSAMRAVRQVYRYDIPQSQKLSRHYRHLEFRYRGGESDS
jgi:hypothetical protein